jgi:hypothetical protein
MPKSSEPLYSKKQANGYRFEVYENRIEFETPGFMKRKKTILLLRNIVSIEKPGMMNCIDIITTSKDKYRLSFWKSGEVRDELVKYL